MKKIVMMLGVLGLSQVMISSKHPSNRFFYFASGIRVGFPTQSEWNDGVHDYSYHQKKGNDSYKKKQYSSAGFHYWMSAQQYWENVQAGYNCGQANHAISQWAQSAYVYILAGNKQKAIEALKKCVSVSYQMIHSEPYRSKNASCGFWHNTLRGTNPYYESDDFQRYYDFYNKRVSILQNMG